MRCDGPGGVFFQGSRGSFGSYGFGRRSLRALRSRPSSVPCRGAVAKLLRPAFAEQPSVSPRPWLLGRPGGARQDGDPTREKAHAHRAAPCLPEPVPRGRSTSAQDGLSAFATRPCDEVEGQCGELPIVDGRVHPPTRELQSFSAQPSPLLGESGQGDGGGQGLSSHVGDLERRRPASLRPQHCSVWLMLTSYEKQHVCVAACCEADHQKVCSRRERPAAKGSELTRSRRSGYARHPRTSASASWEHSTRRPRSAGGGRSWGLVRTLR